jgi:hypothetical protein
MGVRKKTTFELAKKRGYTVPDVQVTVAGKMHNDIKKCKVSKQTNINMQDKLHEEKVTSPQVTSFPRHPRPSGWPLSAARPP